MPAAYEQGQERLRAAILTACEAAAGLRAKVDGGLGAALSLLASDPDLAWLLSVWPERAGGQARRRQGEWGRRYGKLLRDAALRDGAAAPPLFVEPMLIASIGFLVARDVSGGQTRQLEGLLPAARWCVLACYLSPAEIGRLDDVRPLARRGSTR